MMNSWVLVLGLAVAASASSCNYTSVCSDNTMCKYKGFGDQCGTVKYYGVTAASDKQAILDYHNNLRRKVALGQETNGSPGPQPAAANMYQMQYDEELATVAQRWADQCAFGHDSCRNVARFYVGQNVYEGMTSGSPEDGVQDWNSAIQGWYDEVKDFDYDSIKPFQFTESTGHYTQVVWATSKLVGCGFVAYDGDDGWYDKYYVCNYGPGGNILEQTMYEEGTACSKCSGSCNNGLCV